MIRFSLLVGAFFLTLILLSASLVSRHGSSQVPQGKPTLQIELRQIVFAVIDKDQRSIDSLRKEDVRVLEHDKPQEIVAFEKLDGRPLSLAILIDTSVSQEKTLPSQRLAADSFVQTVIRPGRDDRAAIVTFTGKLTVEQALIGDVPLLQQAIARVRFVPPPGYTGGGLIVSRLPPPGDPALGWTALWDAISITCQDVFASASAQSRKAIVLLSDGDDTASKTKLNEAIERAVKSDVAVYSIGIGDGYNFNINTIALRKLSEQTGGQAFFPTKAKNYEAAFATIKALLYLQYKLKYRSLSPWTKKSSTKTRLELINPTLTGKDFHLSYQVLGPRDR